MWEIRPSGFRGARCHPVSCVVSGKRLRKQRLAVNVTSSAEPATTTRDTIHGVLFQGIAVCLGMAAGIAIIAIMDVLDAVNATSLVLLSTVTFMFLRSRLMPIKPFVAVGYLQGHVSVVEPNAEPRALVLPSFSLAAAAPSREHHRGS